METPHFYTVDEANEKLPEVARLINEMQSDAQNLAAMNERSEEVAGRIRSNGSHNPLEDAPLNRSIKELRERLEAGAEQFAAWNIELKDLNLGLVDFPALREGRTVYLCWKQGEPEIAYWHETTSGFAGRQPLDDRFF